MGGVEDLLGIEVDYNADGSITLHQRRYIAKLVERFLPDGVSSRVQGSTLPYTKQLSEHIAAALSRPAGDNPELLKPFQEMVGCLMYATTSTRPDIIAFVVHSLCKCLQRPTQAAARAEKAGFHIMRSPRSGCWRGGAAGLRRREAVIICMMKICRQYFEASGRLELPENLSCVDSCLVPEYSCTIIGA